MTASDARPAIDIRDTDIVVGVDGSSSAKAALRWALNQARLTGARIQAVAVWEMPVIYGWDSYPPYEDLAGTAGKALAEAVQEAIGFEVPSVEVLETILPGHPAQVLLDLSSRAALLVVGSRGRGGFAG